MTKLLLMAVLLLTFQNIALAVEPDSTGRDPKYVTTILERSQKIVDGLSLCRPADNNTVRNIIANRYFHLNDVYERRDNSISSLKSISPDKETLEAGTKTIMNQQDAELYRMHFAFQTALSLYLNDAQIAMVKDGMTFGVLMVTYNSTLEMIPSLTDEEKRQIKAWLTEAREYAMNAESSHKKHEVFGKYKGRINNYLSARGYNLQKEREEWYKRIEQQKSAAQ